MRQKRKYYGIAYDNDEQRVRCIHIMAWDEQSAEQKLADIYPDFNAVAVYSVEELLTQALELVRADPAEIQKNAAKLKKLNNA